METETIVFPEKPVEYEEVRCPNCGHNITISFNSYRTVLLTTAKREYLARKKRLENISSNKPQTKTLGLIENYEQGKEAASFDIFCKGTCDQKLKFTVYNTLTGATRMTDGRPIAIVRPNPKEVPNDF